MARTCLHCGHDAAVADSLYCDACRIRLIKAGMVELALPGEISDGARHFTPYLEVKRQAAAAAQVEPVRPLLTIVRSSAEVAADLAAIAECTGDPRYLDVRD